MTSWAKVSTKTSIPHSVIIRGLHIRLVFNQTKPVRTLFSHTSFLLCDGSFISPPPSPSSAPLLTLFFSNSSKVLIGLTQRHLTLYFQCILPGTPTRRVFCFCQMTLGIWHELIFFFSGTTKRTLIHKGNFHKTRVLTYPHYCSLILYQILLAIE